MTGAITRMHIEAANVRPDFSSRPSIPAADLRHVEEPCVVFEAVWADDDGALCYAYTVGGWLNGGPLGGIGGGVLIGDEAIIVHAEDRDEADAIASAGLQTTIEALDAEEAAYIEANAALARLATVSPMRRMDLAAAAPADRSDEFEADATAIRKLRGDDIVMTVGGVEDAPR
jgi:hypothetical protein